MRTCTGDRQAAAYHPGAEAWVCGCRSPTTHTGRRRRAARYRPPAARNRWCSNSIPPRGRHDEVRALSHVTSSLVMARSDYRTTHLWRMRSHTNNPPRGLASTRGGFRGQKKVPSVAPGHPVAPRSAAHAASPRQRGTPDARSVARVRKGCKPKLALPGSRPRTHIVRTGNRTTARASRSPAESACIVPRVTAMMPAANPNRLHSSEGDPRVKNAARRSRRGRGAWM